MNALRSRWVIAFTPPRRNSAGSLVIQGSQRLARIVTIIAAAAVLDPAAFAALAVALALTDIVRAGLLAYDVSAVRSMSHGADVGRVLGTHLGAKVVVGLIGTIVILGFAAIAYGAGSALLVLVSAIGMLPASVAGLLMARRQVDYRLESAAPAMVVSSIVGAALAIGLLLATNEPIGVVAGLSAGDILLLVALSSGLGEASRVGLAGVVAVIRDVWTLLVMQLAYVGQFRIGTVILGAAGTAVAVAEYTVASRIAEGLVILAAAVTASTLPMMGTAFARNDTTSVRRTMSRSYGLSLFIAAPPVALLALSAPVWISLLFPLYPGAAAVFVPVALTVVVFFASSQTTAFLNASHRDHLAALSASAGLGVAIVGSWWLVTFGAVGVAVARLVAELVRLVIESVAVTRMASGLARAMAMTWIAILPFLAVTIAPVVFGWTVPVVLVGCAIVVAGSIPVMTRLRSTAAA